MAYEHKDNSGSVFPNDRKEIPTHPDWTGSAKIDGVDMWVSAWNKTSGKGDFMTFSFRPKNENN